MLTLLSLLSLFSFVSRGETLFTQTPATSKTQLKMGVGLYGKAVEEISQSGRIAGTRLEGSLKHPLTPQLLIDLKAELKIETGFSQTTFSDEFAPRQAPKVINAQLGWNPISFFTLKTGALDQSLVNSPLLFSDQTFPAVVETFQIPLENLEIRLDLEQAFPGSVSNNATPRPISGPPLFLWSQLSLSWGDNYATLPGKISGSYFNFYNLNEGVSGKSRVWGNSVDGLGTALSNFLYSFEGVELGGELKAAQLFSKPVLRLGTLFNLRAPQGKNLGLYGRLGFEVSPDTNFDFLPRVEVFQIQSDTTPAMYTNKDFGHNNRIGFAAGCDFKFKKENLSFGVNLIASNPIQANPYQSEFKELAVSMKTDFNQF